MNALSVAPGHRGA